MASTPTPNAAEAAASRRAIAARLDRLTLRARVFMALERLTATLWPLASVLFLFAAATLLGLWPQMADWLRFAALAGFAAGLAFAVVYFLRGFRWPSRREARARLDGDDPTRPVADFDDRQALGRSDPGSTGLWIAHQARIAARAAAAVAPPLSLRVGAERDPFAIRYLSALALGAALLLGQPDARLADAFAPPAAPALAAQPQPAVELWATPPAYTGAPPIYFADAADRVGARRTPSGTVVSLRVFDAPSAPVLTLTDAAGAALPIELRDEAEGAYAAEAQLGADAQLSMTLEGERVVDLAFAVTPDAAPEIEITEAPDRGAGGALTFAFQAGDDYGVAKAWAELKLDLSEDPLGPPDAREPLRVGLPTPPNRVLIDLDAIAEEAASLDADDPDGARARARAQASLSTEVEESFAGHPWVGLPVVMVVTVEDGAGQQAASAPTAFRLPGRLFSEPMAKAFMEQRGALVWSLERAPRANRTLEALLARPDDYFTDSTAYLMARTIVSRLGYAIGDERLEAEKDDIVAGMHAVAERLEDGGIENAAERLARAQRRLREALENGASDEEIAELMQELREAIGDYIRALAELAERNPELAQQFNQNTQTLGQNQLQQMLDALEQAAREGQRGQAEQMLSMLEQLLESLRPGGQSQQAGPGDPGQQSGGQQALDELQDMIGEQQGLAERSFDEFLRRRRGEEGQPGQDGQPGRQGPQGAPGQQGQGRDGQGRQQARPGQPGQGQGEGQGDGQAQDQAQGGQGGASRPGEGRRPNGPGAGPDGRMSLNELRARQEALRGALDDFRRGLSDDLDGEGADRADRALGDAEQAMRDAERALREGDPGGAADEQMRAVDSLRDGARAAADALEQARREAQNQEGAQPGEDPTRNGQGQGGATEQVTRDPFGRASGDGGALEGGGVEIPGESPASRARDLLDELRRRSGERERPLFELEYLDRLLDRF